MKNLFIEIINLLIKLSPIANGYGAGIPVKNSNLKPL